MRHSAFVLGCILLVSASAVSAQSKDPMAWAGVWQGQLDGQPSVTLTLAEDTGELGGTVVLNIINRDGGQPHVVAREAHVLVRPRLEADKLSFELMRLNKSEAPMNFTVVFMSEGRAQIHCLNCGENAPIVDLVKEN